MPRAGLAVHLPIIQKDRLEAVCGPSCVAGHRLVSTTYQDLVVGWRSDFAFGGQHCQKSLNLPCPHVVRGRHFAVAAMLADVKPDPIQA
jgi:hypothetical protein